MGDHEVLTEVPGSLKRLVRYIVRGFYSIEHAIIIDLLVHHPCVKEDDLRELTLFDQKQLRQIVNTLKTDKFLKDRMRLETDSEGKSTKHHYYFINYSSFVNVVKYKLDHMQRKIETEERDSTSRASFKCPGCEKSFTDLEAGELFDPFTGTFLCTYCKSEVQEEATSAPRQDARMLMVKFNEQIQPIYSLLREVEDMKLAPELLEPPPTDIKSLRPKSSAPKPGGEKTTWSGEATRGKNYFDYNGEVTINMQESNEVQVEKKVTKEQPAWMINSTVEGANSEPMKQKEASVTPSLTQTMSLPSLKENDDIMRTLLMHEKKSSGLVIPGVPAGGDTSSSESDPEEFNDPAAAIAGPSAPYTVPPSSSVEAVEEMESEEEDEAMVSVAGVKMPYDQVTQEMVERMSQEEKDAYIKMGQEMFEDMYE